jgi:CHAT domain-containing protein/tetratricopeptide (TPR) repeat protein
MSLKSANKLLIALAGVFLLFSTSGLFAAEPQDHAWKLFQEGKALEKSGPLKDTIPSFMMALEIEKSSKSPRPQFLMLLYAKISTIYFILGNYSAAEEDAKSALLISQKLGDKEAIAGQNRSLGMIYRAWSKYNLALKYFGEALMMNVDLKNHAGVARDLTLVGSVYLAWGEYDEALKFLIQALPISRNLKLHSTTATTLSDIGRVHYAQGNHNKALGFFKEAMTIDKKLGRRSTWAASHTNIGLCYEALGEFEQALVQFKAALELDTKIGKQAAIARDLSHIGLIYFNWGQFDAALDNFKQAMAIATKLNLKAKIALNLNNIGSVLRERGHYDQALAHFKKALEIDRAIGRTGETANDYNNIGLAYLSLNQHEKALENFGAALEIDKKLGRQGNMSRDYNNLGMIADAIGQYKQARDFFQNALAIDKKLENRPAAAIKYNNIGMAAFHLKDYPAAIENFEAAVAIKEKLRITASGNARRDYLASQIHTYQWLMSAYLKDGDLVKTFKVIELSRAKLLAEQLSGTETNFKRPSMGKIQFELDDKTAVLVFASVAEPPLILILITDDSVMGFELDVADLEKKLKSIDLNWKTSLKPLTRGIQISPNSFRPSKKTTPAAFSLADAVHHYRNRLLSPTASSERGIRVTAKNKSKQFWDEAKLGRLLYDFLLLPFEKRLAGKNRLIVVPDGILGYLPFETLRDKKNRFLVESLDIRYIQSMAVLQFIRQRNYTKDRKPMLAFGGAKYPQIAKQTQPVQNARALSALTRQVDDAITQKRSLRKAYAALNLSGWTALPGTLDEVENIAKIVPAAEIVTGSQVAESRLKKMSAENLLKNYSVLHFATHGLVVPAIPELSALVLSQFPDGKTAEDGYLRMGEIARLKIEADFVNLSACQTGLGKIYGGEGVVGLPQAVLVAGANGLSVSLWQVADRSTALFMTALYERVQKEGIGYDTAMTLVKRDFLSGRFGEVFKAPYFWAPFVYYGK